ncbi:hypothetical protein CSA56_11040 [candidate division KSB3 bacterium]|uniref:Uncharacterized protein n=1 Tax=candidate division KSB3 bacterium TaxID=2044937 RepID=A0A2G6KFB5_9BACT|nr:MAG: hypothetical protein CSA56_11040 [candidate division KSB3 bacterium]
MDSTKFSHNFADRNQSTAKIEDAHCFADEEPFDPVVLKTYLKHVGLCKDKKRRRCISSELGKVPVILQYQNDS